MADPVGLAFGAVSLFSTCMDLFEYHQLRRRYEKDYQLVCVQVSMMKANLRSVARALQARGSQWLESALPPRELSERELIHQGLLGIMEVLNHAEQLRDKYRLRIRRSDSASPSILERDAFSSAPPRRACRASVFLLSTTWALRDKRKCDALIAHLDFLISNVQKVVEGLLMAPSSSPQPRRSAAATSSPRRQESPSHLVGANVTDQSIVALRGRQVASQAEVPGAGQARMAQPRSFANSELGHQWNIHQMRGNATAFQGAIDGARLLPAPEGQTIAYSIGIMEDNAKAFGGAISANTFSLFLTGRLGQG